MKLNIFNIFANPRHTVCCAALLAALLLIRFARWLILGCPDAPSTGKPSESWNLAAASADRASNPADRVRLDIAFFEEPESQITIADRLASRGEARNSFAA